MRHRSAFRVFILGLVLLVGTGPLSGHAQGRATTHMIRDTVDHGAFTRVLQRFVDAEGNVDYAGLNAQTGGAFDAYLQQLATATVSDRDRDARLAFWINAYNALTLKLVATHYPVENIWGITPGPAKPKDESPFKLDVAPVADTVRTLDEIEHDIIRKRFSEPRIHFALVCAARSCPRLRQRAYVGSRLDAQLSEQARAFLHDRDKNRIPASSDRIELSRILKWYGSDFGSSTSDLQRALAPYFEGTVREKLEDAAYEVGYRPYDWSLNDQSGHTEGE